MSGSINLSAPPTAYPSGRSAWMRERGLTAVLMNWVHPDPSDAQPPIDPGLWAHLFKLHEAVLGQVGAYEAADMDMPREIH